MTRLLSKPKKGGDWHPVVVNMDHEIVEALYEDVQLLREQTGIKIERSQVIRKALREYLVGRGLLK